MLYSWRHWTFAKSPSDATHSNFRCLEWQKIYIYILDTHCNEIIFKDLLNLTSVSIGNSARVQHLMSNSRIQRYSSRQHKHAMPPSLSFTRTRFISVLSALHSSNIDIFFLWPMVNLQMPSGHFSKGIASDRNLIKTLNADSNSHFLCICAQWMLKRHSWRTMMDKRQH